MAEVVVTRKIFDGALAQMEAAGVAYALNEADVAWRPDELRAALREATAVVSLLTDRLDAATLAAAPSLKLIANVAVGYDNVDVAAATERGILVTNTPDVLTETTADMAFALLLAIARRLPEADAYMRAGKYKTFELFPELIGVDVYGKTLGIVGMGRIGTAVARRGALGFNMPILYTASSAKPAAERELGARRVTFPTLLQESDFISINAPLTDKTHHLFNLDAFAQMKETAFVVNTARGPLIDEADLVTALERGLIRGAALDVFEDEPHMHPGLLQFPDRLVVAPHLGSASVETRCKMSTLAVANVIAFLAGETPPTPVNLDQLNQRRS